MHKVEEYLEILSRHIKSEIEKAVEEDEIDYDTLDDIADLCDDYNSVFKFAKHHLELMSGCLQKHYDELKNVTKQ